MIVREALAIVVAPAVVALRLHPLQVRAAHSLHVRVLVIPVAGSTVVLFAVVADILMRTATAVTFVIGSHPGVVGAERTVRAEVQRIEVARAASVTAVIDHDVRYSAAVTPLERTDEQTQIGFAAERAVEVAVLERDVSGTTAIGCRRKPYEVKILTQLS